MTTETLTCQACNQNWDRELKRGRKPTKCPDCLNKPAKSRQTKVEPEVLKKAERAYKSRTQMKGRSFKPLGKVEKHVLGSGTVLERYMSFEIDDGVVKQGSIVKEYGMPGRYKVRSLIVRKDGSAYVELVGVAGNYEGKYRAIGVDKISL